MQKARNNQKRDWYLDLVYRDPEFHTDLSLLSSEELMKKYFVNQDEINFFRDGSFARGRFINRRESLAFYTDEENKEITVKIGPDATLSDFKQAWPLIRAMKWSMYGQEERRYRPPENPALVYKVFRLKESGLKRSGIYDLYRSQKLLDEPYNADQFLTPKELIDYCRPYFPKPN